MRPIPVHTVEKYIWNNECTDVIVNSVKSAQNNAINNEKINEFTNQNNIKLSILVAVKHLIASLKFGILMKILIYIRKYEN